jgi:hypothetical protein
MAGAQMNDADHCFTAADRERPEVRVVGQDDETGGASMTKNLEVWAFDELLIEHGADIAARFVQPLHDVRVDVLVCEQRVIEQLHAGTRRAQMCSPFRASAAYWSAAVKPSSEMCG